jgi:hypothetical protein
MARLTDAHDTEDPRRASPSARGRHTPPAPLDDTAEPEGQFPASPVPLDEVGGKEPSPDEHQGATEEQVGDRTGPGAGFDATAEDERGTPAGQSPGASTNPPKREDPPGPRNPKPRGDPPRDKRRKRSGSGSGSG